MSTTAENQLDSTSDEKRPPQRSCPLVRVDTSVDDGNRACTRLA